MNKKQLYILFLFLTQSVFGFSQHTDSLLVVYKNTSQNDTNKLAAAVKLSVAYNETNPDSSLMYALRALNLAKLQSNKNKELGLLRGISNLYFDKENYPKALNYCLTALTLSEEIHSQKLKTNIYTLLGSIYSSMQNQSKALFYYEKALAIEKENKNFLFIPAILNNMGICFMQQDSLLKAEAYFLEAIKIARFRRDNIYLGEYYGNLGSVYERQKNYPQSLNYYFKSLAVCKKLGDQTGIGNSYVAISSVYNQLGDGNTSFLYADSAHQVAKLSNDIRALSSAYQALSSAYSKKGDYKNAYDYFLQYSVINDSIYSIANSSQISNLSAGYEVEQKEIELNAKAKIERERQWLIIMAVSLILILVAVFSLLLFKRFKLISKQKEIIEVQKETLQEKQKEIIDSITYAKRLQTAILPPLYEIDSCLPNSFVYYQPKDIVAGDFYWLYHSVKSESEKTIEDDIILIAAADSTGHGVPGAMVSIVCSNALDKAAKEFNLLEPGKILDKTRALILETFIKSTENIKDGMDISLLCINQTRKTILWSGANNPLWYIVNNELIQLKPDKQPIGVSDSTKSFTTHKIPYQEGTVFYLITDGYADQFGGPNGKKFKSVQLQQLLINIHQQDLADQKVSLAENFVTWKGHLEQVDDVTIIGIKV